ncbi:MAG: histidine phosphatase family protein [Sphingomicrobium sp.]
MIDLWASPSGRTLQTAAIVAEHLGRDFFAIRTDPRLLEIDVGDWQGRLYSDVVAEQGEIVCPERRLFTVVAPNGESYAEVATRVTNWLADLDPARDVLLISHGMTLRVLRGMLGGGDPFGGVIVADDAPQGSILLLEGGGQTMLHPGAGDSIRSAA